MIIGDRRLNIDYFQGAGFGKKGRRTEITSRNGHGLRSVSDGGGKGSEI